VLLLFYVDNVASVRMMLNTYVLLFCVLKGLDLEGAQVFWESHFSKIMNHDQFVKSYSYSFRHMYGKEGARKNYTPYSCMKIIMGTPPESGAFHGCPYRFVVRKLMFLLLYCE
jgi:DNA primase large subunit